MVYHMNLEGIVVNEKVLSSLKYEYSGLHNKAENLFVYENKEHHLKLLLELTDRDSRKYKVLMQYKSNGETKFGSNNPQTNLS